MNTGKVTQVIGSTFDAEFSEEDIPGIYNALKVDVEFKGKRIKVTGEVQQHLGGGKVRAVALGSTDGLARGVEVVDTGAPVSVPVGEETLGRVFNMLGEPVDNLGPVEAKQTYKTLAFKLDAAIAHDILHPVPRRCGSVFPRAARQAEWIRQRT